MAMIKCKECGGEVSSKAAACPKCGAKVPKTSITKLVFLGLIGFFVVSYMMAQSSKTPAEIAAENKAAAEKEMIFQGCFLAQKAIKQQLKAPATAKFPNCYTDYHEFKLWIAKDKKQWEYTGPVDSQNGFGAMIRTNLRVAMTSETGEWKDLKVETVTKLD